MWIYYYLIGHNVLSTNICSNPSDTRSHLFHDTVVVVADVVIVVVVVLFPFVRLSFVFHWKMLFIAYAKWIVYIYFMMPTFVERIQRPFHIAQTRKKRWNNRSKHTATSWMRRRRECHIARLHKHKMKMTKIKIAQHNDSIFEE